MVCEYVCIPIHVYYTYTCMEDHHLKTSIIYCDGPSESGGGGHSLFITQTNLVLLYNGPKCGHVFVLIVFRYLMPYLMCHLHLLLNIYYQFNNTLQLFQTHK